MIDEAHNLIDSILSLHSVSISLSQLASIRSGLVTYYAKFKARFTGANGSYLRQLVLVVKGLAAFAEEWAKDAVDVKGKGKRKEGMVTANEILSGLKGGGALDQINLLKLDEYLKKSRIAQKVSPDGSARQPVRLEKRLPRILGTHRSAATSTAWPERRPPRAARPSARTRPATSTASRPSSRPSPTPPRTAASSSRPSRPPFSPARQPAPR